MGAKKGGKKAASVANNAQDFYDHTFLGNDEEMMFLRARLDSFSKNSKLGSVWPFNEEEESPCTPEKVTSRSHCPTCADPTFF